MDGPTLVAIVERELNKRKIKKAVFYQAIGITSATFSYWRKGTYSPSSANIRAISEFLDLEFSVTLNSQNDVLEQKKEVAPEGDWREEAVRLFSLLSQDERDRELSFLRERTNGRT